MAHLRIPRRSLRPAGWCRIALLSIVIGQPAVSAEAPSGARRLALRDIATYLGLSAEQQAAAGASSADLDRVLSANASRASGRVDAGICRASTDAVAAHQARLAALLTPVQTARLAELDNALRLLPTIESAQAAGFLASTIAAAPVGLPSGSASGEYRWRREPAPALPGCAPSTTSIPREVDRDGGDRGGAPPPQR